MGEPAPGRGARAPIDRLLEDAEVLQDEYDDYDAAAACARARAAPVPPRPGRYPSHHEQAAHDLDLAVSLVVGAPQAADGLTRLVDHQDIQPEGALVFASLLYLVGHTDAAQFWWQFAAGGGSSTAAFCLYLYHQHLGEHRDASYWRLQAEHLRNRACPPAARPGRTTAPLLPTSVRRDLLSQCRQDRSPHLPPALESVINSLAVDEHEDFGELPLPARTLTGNLARAQG